MPTGNETAISLRDRFAAAAMSNPTLAPHLAMVPAERAKWAFEVADQMLAHSAGVGASSESVVSTEKLAALISASEAVSTALAIGPLSVTTDQKTSLRAAIDALGA